MRSRWRARFSSTSARTRRMAPVSVPSFHSRPGPSVRKASAERAWKATGPMPP